MAKFTDNMKRLTDEILSTARERASSLAAVNAETERLLSGARAALDQVGADRRRDVDALRSALADARRLRVQSVRELRAGFAATRSKTVAELRQSLGESVRERRDELTRLRAAFGAARKGHSADLREAGRLWRDRVIG